MGVVLFYFAFVLQKVALLDIKTTKLNNVRFPCCRTFKGVYNKEDIKWSISQTYLTKEPFSYNMNPCRIIVFPPEKRKDDVTDFKMRLFLPQIQLKSQRAYTKVQLRTIHCAIKYTSHARSRNQTTCVGCTKRQGRKSVLSGLARHLPLGYTGKGKQFLWRQSSVC